MKQHLGDGAKTPTKEHTSGLKHDTQLLEKRKGSAFCNTHQLSDRRHIEEPTTENEQHAENETVKQYLFS